MKSSNKARLAGQAVEARDGLRRGYRLENDPVFAAVFHQAWAHCHTVVIAGADNQVCSGLERNPAQVLEVDPVAFLSPPVAEDPVSADNQVAGVSPAVDH